MPEDAEAYEADGVDLSIGGMSLRTSLLPDRGSELACRFKLEDGRRVMTRGEVVWAQDVGSDAGEFGLRFTDLADADENDLYAAMDWLLARQDAIQTKLATRHLRQGGLVLYDLSSSYFEGNTCP
ncbi:MAG: PilZ domain-containing protein, partial [Deltaproteobacteria bacterium]